MARALFLFAVAVAALMASPPLRAHDLWIAPSSFTPAEGEPIRFHLVLANGNQLETVPRNDAGIVRFVAIGPGGDHPVSGIDGLDPAGFLRPTAPGWYTIIYESAPAFTTLAPDTFRAYLLEKGLEAPARPIAVNGQGDASSVAAGSAQPMTSEIFRRSIKARVLVGGASGAASPPEYGEEKPVGLPFELVLERVDTAPDPAAHEIVIRLLLDGAPLEGAQVDLRRLDNHEVAATGRTDCEGRIHLRLGTGSWVATSVHLDPTRPAAADWESVWSSLTFKLD